MSVVSSLCDGLITCEETSYGMWVYLYVIRCNNKERYKHISIYHFQVLRILCTYKLELRNSKNLYTSITEIIAETVISYFHQYITDKSPIQMSVSFSTERIFTLHLINVNNFFSLAISFVPSFNFSFPIHHTDSIITFKLQNFSLDFV